MLKQWNIKGVLEYGQTVILAPVINWPPFILSLEGLISLQSFHWDVGCTGLLCIQWTRLIFVLFSDSGKVVSSDLEGDGWMMWWTKCRFLGTIMHLSSSRQTGILFEGRVTCCFFEMEWYARWSLNAARSFCAVLFCLLQISPAKWQIPCRWK
jgi:hypothetical protein